MVASRPENTQRRRHWLSYKNTAIYLFTKQLFEPQKHIYKTRDLNPKNITTKTRVITTQKTKKHTLKKLKL